MLNKVFIRDTIYPPQPSGMLWRRGFERRGDTVKYLPLEKKGGLKLIEESNYDPNKPTILIDFTNIIDTPTHIEELVHFKSKFPNSKIFLSIYLPFDHVNFSSGPKEIDKRFYAYKDLVDGVFNTVMSFPYAEELFTKIGLKYMTIPFAMDPYYEDYIKGQFFEEEYDIGFIGSIDEGDRFLDIWYEPFRKKQSPEGIYTAYFSGFKRYPSTSFNDTYKLFKQTKINLNPHYSHQFGIPGKKKSFKVFDFNSRTFALAGLGCFQLNNHPYMKKYFGEDIPVFDKDNFMDLFNYYLKNKDERIKISKKMQEITLKEHRMENRIKQLLS